MSDLNWVLEDIKSQNNQQQHDKLSLVDDELKIVSTCENDSKPNHANNIIDEFESKQSVKTTASESPDENDSEYEDVEAEDDDDEINDASGLTSISNKNPFKSCMDDEELHRKVQPRRTINKKLKDDEHSEDNEDDDDNDNQNVPITKKPDKNKQVLDDDNNAHSPAYIPRKGKFYEHDDRTLDENERPKQEISKQDNRFYTDSDAKWQHDLYLRDEEILKSRYPSDKQNRTYFEHGNHRDREHFPLKDTNSQSKTEHNCYHQPQRDYHDYRRRIPHTSYNKLHNNRVNNFDVKEYGQPLSNNRNDSYNRTMNTNEKYHVAPRRQQQQQSDNTNLYHIDERIFHRRRNFTNSQFQQQANELKLHNSNPSRQNPRRFDEKSNEPNQFKHNNEYKNNNSEKLQQEYRGLKKYEFFETKNNLPPRLQLDNPKRNFTQKQPYQQKPTLNLSSQLSNIERPKRYSNMRNHMTNSIEQQTLSSKMQHFQDQRNNKNVELNDWPQAPPPPTAYFPQQNTTPQILYQQPNSQYVPMNYSQQRIYLNSQVSFKKNNSYIISQIVGGTHQRRLLKYLLEDKNYNPLERPVLNDSHTLQVSMSLALQQIMDYDEKNEIIAISGWLVFEWFDYNLQWNPDDYGGITAVRIPCERLWTPDVFLYNSASENFEGTMKTNIVVQNTAVNLTTNSDTGQLDAYVKNAEWDLEAFIAVRKSVKYECCPTVYPFVLFTLQIRRRTLYYVVNVVVPCVLISFMTLLGFILPPDSGEKISLQITILLSVVMFSLLISGIIPASSTALPIIVMYFTTVMLLCTTSVVATVCVLVLHHRNAKSHTMPMWVKVYINQYLACILWMNRPEHDLTWKTIRLQHRRTKERQNSITSIQNCAPTPLLAYSSKSLLANVTSIDDQAYASNSLPNNMNVSIQRQQSKCNNPHHHHYSHDPNEISLPRDMRVFRSELRSIKAEVRFITDHIKKEEEEDDVSQDWRFSAMVLDRLCLIVFSILTTTLSYYTLFSAKNFLKLR
ncbi:unnamed protein product [Rotaria socialis]|uniref:Btz domain-containing protein n=1 Tax=Rotaria socialis TaxID=392032 RepID=A0A818MES9_9BILA|nr:unnamed protein product [Rotaria socialis]CAF4537411.1 unnamed protein product [Rotaria socialis]